MNQQGHQPQGGTMTANAEPPNQGSGAQAPIKRGDLTLERIDPTRMANVQVSATAGGVSFATAIEVMDFARLLATAEQAIPAPFRKNPGMCLAVVFQAVEWRMSPVAVVNKAYIVNDRLAYESQLIHGIVEARAPLESRLRAEYVGEGPTRQCTISGTFFGEKKPHEYTSPQIKDIKVKNSPLWTADPDQQLFYYSTRAWARRWAPDVLLGIYTRDELAANPRFGREDADDPPATTLHQRLAGNDKGEGWPGVDGVRSELANVAPGGDMNAAADQSDAPRQDVVIDNDAGAAVETKPDVTVQDGEPNEPKTAAEYQVFAMDWIDKAGEGNDWKNMATSRWAAEADLRQQCGVDTRMRTAIRKRLETKYGVKL